MTEELIVLVDNAGNHIGQAEKLSSHHDNTPLHLAFSCYVFNDKGELLVTQRAHTKKVWPDVWTNSVCGHPAPKEDMLDAIKRRLDYELGMSATNFQVVLPDYRYITPPYNGIIENEICPVYIARAISKPNPNPEEVDDYSWVNWKNFVESCKNDQNDKYSWWCKDQVKQLSHSAKIGEFTKDY